MHSLSCQETMYILFCNERGVKRSSNTSSGLFSDEKMCFGLVAGRTGKGLGTTKLSGILIGVPGDRHRRTAGYPFTKSKLSLL